MYDSVLTKEEKLIWKLLPFQILNFKELQDQEIQMKTKTTKKTHLTLFRIFLLSTRHSLFNHQKGRK